MCTFGIVHMSFAWITKKNVIIKRTHTHLPVTGGVLINLTANKNWTQHTSKQHKFSERLKATRANVTSYTIMYSSGLVGPKSDCWEGGGGVEPKSRPPGDIFRRNIKDNSAKSRDTEMETKI